MMSTSAMVKGKAGALSPEDVETVREAAMAMYGQFVTAEVWRMRFQYLESIPA